MKLLLFFLLIKVLLVPLAFADILFIDMNFSDKEIKTAQKSAANRGEKLIIYPDASDEDRKMINKMKETIYKLEQKKEKLSKRLKEEKLNKDKNSEKFAALNYEANAAYDELAEAETELSNYCKTKGYEHTTEKLNDVIKKYNVDNGGFSSMIVSSHHADSYFGITGDIGHREFEKIINDSPKAFATMRSVYLWGCYTATKKALLAWKENVPSAYVIAGWEGSGPKQDKVINHDFLTKMLMSEKELSEKTTLAKAISLFKSVPNIKSSTAAYCIGNAYVTNQISEILSKNLTCYSDELEKLKSAQDLVIKYIKADEKGYEDVPRDTQISDLRSAYKLGRKLEHCQETTILKASELDSLLKLIFDRQVRKNFALVYKSDLDSLFETLKRVNAPAEAFIPAMANPDLTRQSILKANQSLQIFIDSKGDKLSIVDSQLLQSMSNRIGNVIEKHQCISSLWIENMDIERLNQQLNKSCANAAK